MSIVHIKTASTNAGSPLLPRSSLKRMESIIMKTVLASLGLILISSDAMAIERYVSTSMTCDRVQATIAADGAAIMRYASTRVAGLPLYGKYVRSGQFCDLGEAAERAYIPASDTSSCRVRECKRIEYVPKERN